MLYSAMLNNAKCVPKINLNLKCTSSPLLLKEHGSGLQTKLYSSCCLHYLGVHPLPEDRDEGLHVEG